MKTKFKVWKKLTIGTGKPDLKGINVSDWAKDLLSKTKFSKTKRTIDLVKVTQEDLGLGIDTWNTTKQIWDAAKESGLELVPAEAGPILREEYRDQPEGEWLVMGMDPIAGSDGYPSVFDVYRGSDGLWLRDFWAKPDDEWYPSNEFVFSLRKSLDSLTLRPLRSHKPKKKHIADVGKKVCKHDWQLFQYSTFIAAICKKCLERKSV